jgi:LCP family protein required for cell wall assembly
MLEHLDDPGGWALDRDAVVRRGRSIRRRRRLVAGAVGTLACVAAGGVAGALYIDRRDDAIDRVDVSTPSPSLDGAVNVLLAGVDEHGGRADTIAVIRVEEGAPAQVLFVPRDLWDPHAEQRMAALGADPTALVAGIDRTLGVPVDHYVELDMRGFVDLVDELGGLRLSVDAEVRDRHSGLALAPATCAVLDGEAALALVRSRHLEVREPDGWTVDPSGDLGRIGRGRAVVAAVVQELTGVGPDPLELDRLSRVLADHAVLDRGLSLARLVELGRAVASSGAVATDVVPAVPAVRGNGAAVLDVAPHAPLVLERYGAPATGLGSEPPPPPVPTVVPFTPC